MDRYLASHIIADLTRKIVLLTGPSRARSSKLINWEGSTTRRKRDQIAVSLNSKGAAKWMQV